MYIPSNFASIYVLNRYGVKISIVVACLLFMIGAWLRLFLFFSEDSFTVFFVGTFTAAFGQAFVMNLSSKIASKWFGDKERALACAIGLCGSPIGSFVSFLLPSFVIKDSDYNNLTLGRQHFLMYILIQTMIVTVCCIPALAFMREDPPSPPSVVANDTDNNIPFGESLKSLVQNWNYLKIFFVYLFISGINNSIGSIYSNLASKYNYSLLTTSVGCLLSIFGGIVFSFVVGALLDRYQAYKKLQIYICSLAIVGAAYHTFSLPHGNPYLEIVGMFMTGSTTITVCAVTFPFAVEATFPIGEALSNGSMITVGLLWSFIQGIICG